MTRPHASWADAYDRLYQRSFGSFYDDLTQLTVDAIQELTLPTSRIVDFGAGTGRIALPLARTGRHVTAVEPCAEMLQVLQSKQGDTVLEVVNCTMADFESNQPYDFGTCVFTVLLYLLDEAELEASLKAAAEALRPGAKFMIDIPSRALFSQSHRKGEDFDRFVDIQPLGTDLYRYDENSMLVDDAGFERHLTDSFTIRYWRPDVVLSITDRLGLAFDKDLSHEFLGTGSEYFLLKKL
jgi:SAM-dependent methyltransferase